MRISKWKTRTGIPRLFVVAICVCVYGSRTFTVCVANAFLDAHIAHLTKRSEQKPLSMDEWTEKNKVRAYANAASVSSVYSVYVVCICKIYLSLTPSQPHHSSMRTSSVCAG